MAKQSAPERRPFRSGLVVRGFLIAATLGGCGALAYVPVTQYIDMRGQSAEAEAEADALDIARPEAQTKLSDAEKRNEERARCFNTWVPIGEETYVVQGLLTCDD